MLPSSLYAPLSRPELGTCSAFRVLADDFPLGDIGIVLVIDSTVRETGIRDLGLGCGLVHADDEGDVHKSGGNGYEITDLSLYLHFIYMARRALADVRSGKEVGLLSGEPIDRKTFTPYRKLRESRESGVYWRATRLAEELDGRRGGGAGDFTSGLGFFVERCPLNPTPRATWGRVGGGSGCGGRGGSGSADGFLSGLYGDPLTLGFIGAGGFLRQSSLVGDVGLLGGGEGGELRSFSGVGGHLFFFDGESGAVGQLNFHTRGSGGSSGDFRARRRTNDPGIRGDGDRFCQIKYPAAGLLRGIGGGCRSGLRGSGEGRGDR